MIDNHFDNMRLNTKLGHMGDSGPSQIMNRPWLRELDIGIELFLNLENPEIDVLPLVENTKSQPATRGTLLMISLPIWGMGTTCGLLFFVLVGGGSKSRSCRQARTIS